MSTPSLNLVKLDEKLLDQEDIDSNLFAGVYDTSRLFTYVVAVFLIIYGSRRALNHEKLSQEQKEDDDENNKAEASHTIELSQAIFLPIGASLSLLMMFLFFNVFQFVFMISTLVLSIVSFSFLILPMCEMGILQCTEAGNNKISLGCCGRYTPTEILSLTISCLVVSLWVFTGHWILMDALGVGLCITMMSYIKLPNLKVSTLLLGGLLIYDVFWVFCSEYFFNDNVMVKVATRPAYNPMSYVVKKLNVQSFLPVPQELSMPGKLMFPSSRHPGRFGMLGLGDIVMPGLLTSFVLRYENILQKPRTSYFHTCIIGYFIGLIIATFASEVYHAAQPALLYLVPFTLLPLIGKAYSKGDLKVMWSFGDISDVQNNLLV